MQGYIVLFAFIANKLGEPLEKIKAILGISIKTRISLKYCEYYKKEIILINFIFHVQISVLKLIKIKNFHESLISSNLYNYF